MKVKIAIMVLSLLLGYLVGLGVTGYYKSIKVEEELLSLQFDVYRHLHGESTNGN